MFILPSIKNLVSLGDIQAIDDLPSFLTGEAAPTLYTGCSEAAPTSNDDGWPRRVPMEASAASVCQAEDAGGRPGSAAAGISGGGSDGGDVGPVTALWVFVFVCSTSGGSFFVAG